MLLLLLLPDSRGSLLVPDVSLPLNHLRSRRGSWVQVPWPLSLLPYLPPSLALSLSLSTRSHSAARLPFHCLFNCLSSAFQETTAAAAAGELEERQKRLPQYSPRDPISRALAVSLVCVCVPLFLFPFPFRHLIHTHSHTHTHKRCMRASEARCLGANCSPLIPLLH